MEVLRKKNGRLTYVIAEVGQNHQGDSEIALAYVREFAACGADAVKFQMRDNKILFDEAAYNKPYESENSFGDTYGKHREFLELDFDSFREIAETCKNNDVDLIITPFDSPSLERLTDLDVSAIKVASFDLGNVKFLREIAKASRPVVLSTGGGQDEVIEKSVDVLLENGAEVALLHCVSQYPCAPSDLQLWKIGKLKQFYGDKCEIGLSDHFNGILSGPIGFLCGATIFEKHVTFDRSWKGTDHSFALEPHGFKNFVRDIERAALMMSENRGYELGNEPVFKKLGKSICAQTDLEEGEVISFENIDSKIFGQQGIPVRELSTVLGRVVCKKICMGSQITYDDLQM